MKICPVCNDTFADQLNFCDVDGTRLTQAGGAQERNKWWSLVGAGLLIGALVISAASIFFLPRSRVPAPIVSSEPTPAPVTPKPAPAAASETTASAGTPAASAEPETPSTESLAPELKRKEKAISNSNSSSALPNPKAAALAAEEGDKKPATLDPATVTTTPKKPEAPAIKAVSEPHPGDPTIKPQTPPDPKKDPKGQVASANHEKDSKDKKKDEEKKKGGFLKVFKKIFGKD